MADVSDPDLVDLATLEQPNALLPEEDDAEDDDLSLQRYNAQLPPSYRRTLVPEKKLLMRALHVLIRAVTSAPEADPSAPARRFAPLPEDRRVAEGYEHEFERDYAALEKGVCRILDLKHAFEARDYPVLVNVLMRGALTEGIDMGLRSKLARCCASVLQKRQCVLPEGVSWRPVMRAVVKHHIHCVTGGVYIGKDVRDSHCRNMLSLMRVTRHYNQGCEGAQQVWEHFLPQLGEEVEIDTRFQGLLLMWQVLPTRGVEWSGWVPRGMELWQSVDSSTDWDSIWMSLVARLAKHQPCNHDWQAHLPLVYSRLTRAFRLPLGAIATQSAIDRRCPHFCLFLYDAKIVPSAAAFIVYSLSPKSPRTWEFLDRIFALIANYFHPSNSGRWSHTIGTFLVHITANLVVRILEERVATAAGVNERVTGTKVQKGVAELEHRLSQENIAHLANLLLPLVQLALHSKSSAVSVQAASAARDLAIFAPDIVITPFLMQASEGLESISSPHRTTAALRLLSTISSVFLDTDFYPDGPEFLPQIMSLTLPGIDPNDLSKTESTLKFLSATAARLQSIVASNPKGGIALFLEEYVHLLLERTFALLESLEAPARKGRNGAFHAGSPFSYQIFSVCMENLLGALPGELAVSVAQRISRQVCGAACSNAIKYYAVLVRCSASAADSAKKGSAVSIFVPALLAQIKEGGDVSSSNEAAGPSLASVGDLELVWRIRMLAQACRSCGSEVLGHLNEITDVIQLAMSKPERPVYKAGGRLLRGVLEGLTSTRMEFGAGSGEDGDSMADGQAYSFQWKEPTAEEWKGAETCVEQFITLAEDLWYGKGGMDGKSEVTADRDAIFRVLRMLHAIQRGGRWLLAGAMPDHFAALDKLLDPKIEMSKVQAELALKRPLTAGLGGERGPEARTLAVKLWKRIFGLASDIIASVMSTRPDDGALLYRCVEPIEIAHEPFRRGHQSRAPIQTSRSYKALYRAIVMSKRTYGSDGGLGRLMPRFIAKLRVEAHHEVRLSIAVRGGSCADELNDRIIAQLTDLAVNDFPRVRAEARGVLARSLRFALPAVRRREILRMVDLLDDATGSGSTSTAESVHTLPQSSAGDSNGDAMAHEEKDPVADNWTEKHASTSRGEVKYEQMMGAAGILRSSAVAPIVMREWGLFSRVVKVLLRAMLSAERADASGVTSMLFVKLAALVRPLGIEPIRLVREKDYSIPEGGPLNDSDTDERRRRLKAYEELHSYLLGLVDGSKVPANVENGVSSADTMQDSDNVEEGQVHWRVQSLSATILYITMREDRAPSAAVAEFFIKGMASDVVSLRQVCSKAVMFILAVHGRREGSPLSGAALLPAHDGSPSSWETLGNTALSTIGNVVTAEGFARKLVHTLALDHDDGNGDGLSDAGSRRNAVGNAGGPIAVMNLARHIDGDACWMLVGGRPWPSSWIPRSRDDLNIVRMRLYESFVRVYGMSVAGVFLSTLIELVDKLNGKEEKIISGVKDEDIRVLAGELLSSICRGLDNARCTEGATEEKLVTQALALLGDMSGRMGNLTGGTIIRLIATSEDFAVGSRIWKGILDWLLNTKPIIVPMGDGPVAYLQARRLRYLHSCMADVSEAKKDSMILFTRETLDDLTGVAGFDHELKTVREEVARCLALIATNVPPECDDEFCERIHALTSRLESAANSPDSKSEGDSEMDVDGDSAETDSRKSRSRQGETLCRFVSIVLWGGKAKAFEKYIPDVIPSLFASFDESDPERISYARMCLSFSAQGSYSVDTIERVVEIVESASRDTRWKVRASVLAFVQVFSFASLFTASPACLERIRGIVFNLLADSQLEVRQAAASAFVTMIRDSPREAVGQVRQACLDILAKSAPKRRGTKREPMSAENVRKRHGAVLGLSSMITSSPYSVPEWMPSVLVALSKCVNDPPPISTSTRKLFTDFMRTHRDEWATHKLAFTPDELEIVSELLVSPSYYA